MRVALLLLLLAAACRQPTAPDGPCSVWYRGQTNGAPSVTMVCYQECPADLRAQVGQPGVSTEWLCE